MSARIVHLIDTGGPGGAESVYSALAEGLEEHGWTNIPVVPTPGWLESRVEKSGLVPTVIESRRSFDVGYFWRLVRFLDRSDADLVQAHLLTSSVYGSAAASVCGIPSVCTFHGFADLPDNDRFATTKSRLLRHSRSRFVFVSESLRSAAMEESFCDRTRTEVIHNGVDLGSFGSTRSGAFRRELGIGDDEILVGAIGNVRPTKNYDLLLRVAARLRNVCTRYRFVIVGDTDHDLYSELCRKRDQLDLAHDVAFVGLRDDVPQILPDLDIFLLTSSSEGFSLAVIEAQASGVPVVATRCGGPEEIITDGVDGRLVESGSVDGLEAAVVELVEQPCMARRFVARGRRNVEERFSQAHMIRSYASLYEDCLS